ncbi:MAG: GGDEF domain-containing protein [Smithella sp.]
MYSIFPKDDPKQTLRIKRFLMAFGSYIMWMTITFVLYSQLQIKRQTLNEIITNFLEIIICNLLIYAIIRSGLNKKFKDPSLTLLQMILATYWVMVIVYYADSMRGLVLLGSMVVFVFGLFKLNVRQFLFLSAYAVVNYAVVIFMLYKTHPQSVNKSVDVLNIMILALVLPWFSMVGGYITKLRMKVAKSLSDVRESEKKYLELSIIDDLSQLYNSRHFYSQLEKEIERSNRYEQPLTLLMLDLDTFKDFNDKYGHIKGDNVLSRLGQVIKRCVRDPDSAYRYGGEEFMIMLPMTTAANGIVTAKRIQEEFRTESFTPVPGEDVFVTMSIGLAQYKSKEDMRAFVDRVDKLMYQAKQQGKDRICSE